MKWTFNRSMVGNWIFCLTILLHKCSENRAITNRNNGQTHEGSVRRFRHIAGIPSNSPSNWEVGLREAAIQALLRENGCCLHPQLRALINSAPFIGRRETTTPFGDVVVLSRGQLYQVGGAYVFVQDPWENDCDECHNARRQCGPGGWCQVWKPRNHERLVALWTVKRLRHRNPDHTHRYELEFTVSPINAEMEAYITRNGRFDYFIPGHVFVIKKEESRSKQIAEEEIYNRKIPHVHYKPDVIIGIDHQGQKHILHSYPGFFTSQPIPATDHKYHSNQDRKEIDLYRKLIDSLAAKTTGTTGGDQVGSKFPSNQNVPTKLTTTVPYYPTKKPTTHTPAMTKPIKTMIHYFMPMGEVLLTTEPVTTKTTPPMTTDDLYFLFPDIQTTATTTKITDRYYSTIKPTLTTESVDIGDVFYNTVEKPTTVIKSTEPMKTTTTTMSMHETDILYPEIEKTTIRSKLGSPTTTSNEMLKPYDTTMTTTNMFFKKTEPEIEKTTASTVPNFMESMAPTKTPEYTHKSTEPSGSTVTPGVKMNIPTEPNNIPKTRPETTYPDKSTEPSGNTVAKMETTYHNIPIKPSHTPGVKVETTHHNIPTEPNNIPKTRPETTYPYKSTEPSGSTVTKMATTHHNIPIEPSHTPGVKMETTHHNIPTEPNNIPKTRPETTYPYKSTEPSGSTVTKMATTHHNIPIEPSHTPGVKMETTQHNIPTEPSQIPKTKPETTYPYKSTERSGSTVAKIPNIPTEPSHTPEVKIATTHHNISTTKVETTYPYKSTEASSIQIDKMETTNQHKPTKSTRMYDNKNDTTSHHKPTMTSSISVDERKTTYHYKSTSSSIPVNRIETTKEYKQTNETGISVNNIQTKYPIVEKTTARAKYTKKYQKTLPSRHKTTTRSFVIYSTRKYYTTKKTRYTIPSTKFKNESPTPISTSTSIAETFTTSKIPFQTTVVEDKPTKPKKTTFGTSSTKELTTKAAPIQSVVTKPLKESIQTSTIGREITTMDSLSKITTIPSTTKETSLKHSTWAIPTTTEPTNHSTTLTFILNVTTPEIISNIAAADTSSATKFTTETISTIPMKFTKQQETITNQVPEPHTDNYTTPHFDSTTPMTTIHERNTAPQMTSTVELFPLSSKSTNATTERTTEATSLDETLATEFTETTEATKDTQHHAVEETSTASSRKPIQTSTSPTTKYVKESTEGKTKTETTIQYSTITSTEMNKITPTRTTTVTNFLTDDVPVHEPILTKPIHKDYDEDDIFGTTVIKQIPTETTATKLTESDLAMELFDDKNAKVIFSNFYEASTSPVQTSTDKKEINAQPLTSQSYETSISYEINKRNRRKMKTTTEIPTPAPSVIPTPANVIEIMNKGSYSVYKAELPEDTTEGKNITNLTFISSRDSNVSNLEIIKINISSASNLFKNLESVKANVSEIVLEPGYSVYRAEMPNVEVVTDQNVATGITTDSKLITANHENQLPETKNDSNHNRASNVTSTPETHSNLVSKASLDDNDDYAFLNSEMSVSNTTEENSSKVFNDLALQLVNHARTINYLNNNRTRNKRGKYKRRRTYIPRNRKNNSRKT